MRSPSCRSVPLLVIGVVLTLLLGCGGNAEQAMVQEAPQRSAWLAYWDVEAGKKDLHEYESALQKLVYFAAYFNNQDRLFIPQELIAARDGLQQKRYDKYLSFVNDVQLSDGASALKDLEVLRRVLRDDKARARHADEIIDLAVKGHFQGVEIDYERVWKDEEIATFFVKFIEVLQAKAVQNKLKVRVVLEPSAPFGTAKFAPGPEYVVMMYNLYGVHSGPGPKADSEFIRKILKKMERLPGSKSMAIATGGCLWNEQGERRFVSQEEAEALARINGTSPSRDAGSGCLVFSFGIPGTRTEVWYADVETLNQWQQTAKECGYNNISIWRLGGNRELGQLKKQ